MTVPPAARQERILNTLYTLYGESLMTYTGRWPNDSNARGQHLDEDLDAEQVVLGLGPVAPPGLRARRDLEL